MEESHKKVKHQLELALCQLSEEEGKWKEAEKKVGEFMIELKATTKILRMERVRSS